MFSATQIAKGQHTINHICSQSCERITGSASLPFQEEPCVFNIPGSSLSPLMHKDPFASCRILCPLVASTGTRHVHGAHNTHIHRIIFFLKERKENAPTDMVPS